MKFIQRRELILGVIFLIGLGIYFRIANLGFRVFWVDEVATVIRASGYTKTEITMQLATGQAHTPADLLAFQQLSPDRSWSNTIHALSLSPEHAPLYFLLSRAWMQLWGSSIVAIRSLSVLCSLLTLPVMVALGRVAFDRRNRIALIAVILLSVSPFFVAYAQEARPYSLWLLLIVLSQWLLFRAMRLNRSWDWIAYGVALTLSCYTSLLSIPLTLSQAIIGLTLPRSRSQCLWLTLSGVGFAILPWLGVIWYHQSALVDNTTWMRTSISPLSILAIWLYSFVILFFDVPVITSGLGSIGQAMIALIVLMICGLALWKALRCDRFTQLWLSSLMLPIPIVLVLLDGIFQGQASATPRYWVPTQLGVLLAVAYLTSRKHRFALGLLAILLSLSLWSSWGNLDRIPAYQKAQSRHNREIAGIINQTTRPMLISEATQTIDLLSLSHDLQPSTEIRILPPQAHPPIEARIPDWTPLLTDRQPIFWFAPSAAWLMALQQNPAIELVERYRPDLITDEDIYRSLWQIQLSSSVVPFNHENISNCGNISNLCNRN